MEIKIDKFKLIAGGIGGIQVWRVEPVRKGKIVRLDAVERTTKIPLDKPLRKKIQKLRYYFLIITRHWMSPFDKYMDTEKMEPMPPPENTDTMPVGHDLLTKLWNSTAINGLSLKDDGFVIMGTVESVAGKNMAINTPYITSEDDYFFYQETMSFIDELNQDINEALYSNILPLEEARESYMLENNVTKLSEDDEELLLNQLITKFHEKGAIVLMDGSENIDALSMGDQEEPKTTVHQSKNNLMPGRFEDAEDADEEDQQMIIPENKGKVPNQFSEGTADKQPENLPDMESSDNMLVEDSWDDE